MVATVPGVNLTIWKLSWRLAKEQKFLLGFAISATLIAATIAAGIPQYLSGIETATLEHEFARYSEDQVNGWINVRDVPFNPAAFISITNEIDAATAELGDIGSREGIAIRSAPYSVSAVADERFAVFTNLHMQSAQGADLPLRYELGIAPAPSSTGIAIPLAVAETTGVGIGDILTVRSIRNEEELELTITGLYEPLNSSNSPWSGISRDLLTPDTASAGFSTSFIGIVDQNTLFSISSRSSSTLGTGWWLISVDSLRVVDAGVNSSIERINAFSKPAKAVSPAAEVFIGAEAPLLKIRRDKSTQITPVALSAVLLLLVAGQVVLMSGSAMTSSAQNSISRMGLRGGTTLHVLGFNSISAAVVLVISALLAPPLVWLVVPVLGTVEALEPLTNGARLPISPSVTDFGIAAGVGMLSVLIILLPGIKLFVLRRLPKSARDRSVLAPWLWRMKLDLLIVGISALVLWEMDSRQLLSASADSSSSIMWVMVSTGIVVLAAMLALVRIWPVAPRMIASVLGRTSATVWYAFTSMRRSSFRHAWLLTLITIVTITAVADSTIASSLEANGLLAAAQTAGADARITGLDGYRGESNPATLKLLAGDYIEQWTPALRTRGNLGANGEGAELNLLAVDPDALSLLLVDESMRSAAEQAAQMLSPANEDSRPVRIMLPNDTASLHMVGAMSKPLIDIWVRLKGSDGATTTILMVPTEENNPDPTAEIFTGVITDISNGPYELLSILIYEPPVGPVGHKVILTVENLEAMTAFGEAKVIEDLESINDWYVLPTNSGLDGSNVELKREREGILRAQFGSGTDGGIRGFHSRSDLQYLPILIGDEFGNSSDLDLGDTGFITVFGKVVPVEVVGILNSFATLDSGSSFVVVDYRTLLDFLALKIDPVLPNSAELFITTEVDLSQNLRSLVETTGGGDLQVFEYQRLVRDSTASAGASAGWKGMHIVVTFGLGFLVIVGLLLFVRLDFQETDHSSDVLSALGVTKLGLAIERLIRFGVVGAIGVLAGIVFGGLLGSFVVVHITNVYATEAVERSSRVTAIGFDTVILVITLLLVGMISLLTITLLQGRRQIIGHQGRTG